MKSTIKTAALITILAAALTAVTGCNKKNDAALPETGGAGETIQQEQRGETVSAQTGGTAAADYDYSKILKGDFSDFAGTWVNNAGEREQLNADGTFELKTGGINYWAKDFRPYTAGAYIWSAGWASTDGGDGSDFEVILFPVGVEVYNYSDVLVQSDKTKVRLHKGFTGFDELYYPE